MKRRSLMAGLLAAPALALAGRAGASDGTGLPDNGTDRVRLRLPGHQVTPRALVLDTPDGAALLDLRPVATLLPLRRLDLGPGLDPLVRRPVRVRLAGATPLGAVTVAQGDVLRVAGGAVPDRIAIANRRIEYRPAVRMRRYTGPLPAPGDIAIGTAWQAEDELILVIPPVALPQG